MNSGCNLHGEIVTGEILGKEKGSILCICGLREALAVGCCQEGHPSVKSMPNQSPGLGCLANCRPLAPTTY